MSTDATPASAHEIPIDGLARATATGGATPAPQAPPRRRWLRRAPLQFGEVRIYQHSNLLYWWAVWAYGFFCAGLTRWQGIGIKELAAADADGREKVILFFPSPWLGISFIALVLFVIVFTNVRARGVYSFVLLAVAIGLGWGLTHIPGIDVVMNWASLLRIHLNLAFYLAFSALLMLLWLFVTVFVDHFTWWRFSPGQVIEEHRIGQATGHAYNTEGMVVRRLPDDFFRHRILGLGLIGLGTGDFIVKPPYEDAFEIHNVWRANIKQRAMERMIATRITESAQTRT
jgi:hypothetical protein